MNIQSTTITLPDGREIKVETGQLARQADGAVLLRMGNTMILATAVADHNAREGIDFLPLSVDYLEKFASGGKIPGSFPRREGRASEHEILVSRLVDRALRPLFPDDYHADTQINIWLLSYDEAAVPDALAALAASFALSISDIPFPEPISEVRVIKHNGEFLVNPPLNLLNEAEMDIIVAASFDNILMVEGEMKEVSEADMLEGMRIAHEAIKIHCKAQTAFAERLGRTAKRTYSHETNDAELEKLVHSSVYDKVYAALKAGINNSKADRKAAIAVIAEEFVAGLPSDHTYEKGLISKYFKKAHKKAARDLVLNDGIRLDGRLKDQIRPIWAQADFLPGTHGSALFTRGETQSLTTITLGTKLDEQIIDGVVHEGMNKFMLHYNFPAFATNEVRPNRAPSRREVGHGNLALRALKHIKPAHEEFPYTIRIVSDILESNGSSSMATVCAGSMALMDAGIKMKAAVSGIAMGMISDSKTGKYAILSDILGDEDHLGDMDFKVTGTEKGITACQMDMKVDGLSYQVLAEALEQAKRGRLHILGEMNKAISESRPDLKPHAPRSVVIQIPKELIGAVIGPGGKIVQDIQKTTGATVVIEESNTHGLVNIYATNDTIMAAAVARVQEIVAEPEVGKIYKGLVKSIQTFGAFVEFMKGKEGLLHISEITWERLENMDGVLEIGEEVQVKLLEVDQKTGKFRLSRKELLPRPDHIPERSSTPRTNNGGGSRPPFKSRR
ncbi:MAG: polyribonucleotide nucleotidyltransferase [Cytophagales bacterium]|nr:MAG: polyribonucleotide nucleotidyltransferase [Cytophagales bacterium]TAF61123.1 MAG: polyribonucleotide nucleotidyltransferase [Cytophagales bacterium]